MEGILLLLFGYAISKAIAGDDNKKRSRSKRRSTSFWGDDSSYSAYDTWRKSHGDQNHLF